MASHVCSDGFHKVVHSSSCRVEGATTTTRTNRLSDLHDEILMNALYYAQISMPKATRLASPEVPVLVELIKNAKLKGIGEATPRCTLSDRISINLISCHRESSYPADPMHLSNFTLNGFLFFLSQGIARCFYCFLCWPHNNRRFHCRLFPRRTELSK